VTEQQRFATSARAGKGSLGARMAATHYNYVKFAWKVHRAAR